MAPAPAMTPEMSPGNRAKPRRGSLTSSGEENRVPHLMQTSPGFFFSVRLPNSRPNIFIAMSFLLPNEKSSPTAAGGEGGQEGGGR